MTEAVLREEVWFPTLDPGLSGFLYNFVHGDSSMNVVLDNISKSCFHVAPFSVQAGICKLKSIINLSIEFEVLVMTWLLKRGRMVLFLYYPVLNCLNSDFILATIKTPEFVSSVSVVLTAPQVSSLIPVPFALALKDTNECKGAIPAENKKDEKKKTYKKQELPSHEDRLYDEGYAWVVAVSAFIVTTIVTVNIVSFGVLLTEFALHFDLQFAQLSILAAIRMGFTYGSGIFAGVLVHRFGCRPVGILGICCSAAGCLSAAFIDNFKLLIVTFGFLAGFGAGVLYVVPIVVISKFFKKKRVLATSVSSGGFSFGPVIVGLTGGFIIQNDTVTVTVIEVQKLQQPKCMSVMTKLNFVDVSLLKNRNFSVFTLAALPIMCGTIAFYALGPNRAYIQGVSKVQSSFISAAVGSFSIIGRILSGVIGNRKIISSKLHFSLAVLAAGSIIALSTLAGASLSLHITFAAIFGIFFGEIGISTKNRIYLSVVIYKMHVLNLLLNHILHWS
ncbi:hypothetical protein CAPTEDRAFT_195596 [Capitella teleta]|uniref:Major facilitator superfamily (MFS) profile domain-containing protein n=1 Tax=Capitella teleta TaxID=283909 RepID=R7UB29_CAPTE|nr:hypothetical protein CAPTEDRAFT_195596 [Capitella teleta]|eukprot:ELU03199.1 hypothetical protein CAPTEDRAFT_195596 [Capitella teleta]